jgi:hypothetical protein
MSSSHPRASRPKALALHALTLVITARVNSRNATTRWQQTIRARWSHNRRGWILPGQRARCLPTRPCPADASRPKPTRRPVPYLCADSQRAPTAVFRCRTLDPNVLIIILTSGDKGPRTPDHQWAYLSSVARLSPCDVTQLAKRLGQVNVGVSVDRFRAASSTRIAVPAPAHVRARTILAAAPDPLPPSGSLWPSCARYCARPGRNRGIDTEAARLREAFRAPQMRQPPPRRYATKLLDN